MGFQATEREEGKTITSEIMFAVVSAAAKDIKLQASHSSLIWVMRESLLSGDACCSPKP